jgi:hypothetical protein
MLQTAMIAGFMLGLTAGLGTAFALCWRNYQETKNNLAASVEAITAARAGAVAMQAQSEHWLEQVRMYAAAQLRDGDNAPIRLN